MCILSKRKAIIQVNKLFKRYYNSVLKPEEFSEVSDFISEKRNTLSVFSAMKFFWSEETKRTDVAPRSNPELLLKIKEAIARDRQKHISKKLSFYQWGLRVAAVLIIALLVGHFLFEESGFSEMPEQTITTPPGAKTSYTLPDGSLVWLNSGSTFSYPVRFGKTREVKLIGEAFFKVVKSDNPFIVSTQYGNVIVKGTSFNVNAYTDVNAFETTLVEGSVAFKIKGTENEVTLKPGEQIQKTGQGYAIKPVETKYFTSWKEGKLLFNREPFPSFVKKLERWYNVKIEYNDPKLDEIWYTGTIEMESISEVMEMISRAAPVSYSFNNKTRVFTIKTK